MKPLDDVRIEEKWLRSPALVRLFDILCADGGEAMINGGAVRNALMGMPIGDIDLSTTLLPDDAMKRVTDAGHKAIATGIDHGTITAVIDGTPFEVTTLREDIETDGRHAVVQFGTDWQRDAERRDLTMNGLYCDRDGRVYDYVDGYKDVLSGEVRFIGDADTRIREDGLRILRFFRFFAWYGNGRPEASGLKASVANRDMIQKLSAERLWVEFRKLLGAADPGRALLWMRTTGVLGEVLPESTNWGIDAIPGLIRNEQALGWRADPMLRMMAMMRPAEETVTRVGDRLLLSNKEKVRLLNWATSLPPKPQTESQELEKLLYRGSVEGVIDAMRLEVGHLQNREDDEGERGMIALLNHAENWSKPVFPVKGQDLIDLGVEPGPAMGERLAELEDRWVESGFKLDKQALLGS